MTIDTSRLHLDEMIAQGYRTKKTLVWGTPVSAATREHERAEIENERTLLHKISWALRARGRIKMAHTPRRLGESTRQADWSQVY